jgi:hypothetical protein
MMKQDRFRYFRHRPSPEDMQVGRRWLMIPIRGEADAKNVEKLLLSKIWPVKKQNQ